MKIGVALSGGGIRGIAHAGVLKALEENNIKITFFMVGDWIEKFPEAVKKIYEAGHEIGSHSDTHPHVNNLSYEENIDEIEKCNEKIEKITGEKTKLYRPPYGEYNNTVIKAAQDKGYYSIQWNLDTLDYSRTNRGRNVEQNKRQNKERGYNTKP